MILDGILAGLNFVFV